MAFTVLEMPKRLDAALVSTTQNKVRKAFKTETDVIILDFAACGFIDSRGLAVVVTGLKLAEQTRKRFRLVHVSAEIRMLLKLTRLDRICDIHESMASARGE